MIKGIIFDLDGVLLSTDRFHFQAWKSIADDLNIEFDEETNDLLRGVSRMRSLEIILEKNGIQMGEKEKEALCEKKNERYRKFLETLTPESVEKETVEVLEFLKKSQILLAVGSVSKNTRFILEKTGLIGYFDVIVDGNAIRHSKPDPEVFDTARNLLNLKKDECLVVEDAFSGIDSAKSAGIKACGIKDAARYEKTDYPIESLHDVIEIASRGIVIRHLKKIYPNGFEAVKDFNLEIDDKEFVVFVGPSGCGKSTVLRMIAGLEEITSGELFIDGIPANNQESKDRNISMVFQNYALYPHYTVRQNIGFPLLIEKIPPRHWFDLKYRRERKRKINEKVEEVASKIGLSSYLDVKPKFLSGGQRQRVALGRAIIRNPRCFLLDEPLSNLDAKMRAQMRIEISRLHQELQKTFIYVTHDQIEAMTMGSKIVVMKDGVIQQIAEPYQLYNDPINQFVAGFIGTPQMNFIDGKLHESEGVFTYENQSFRFQLPESVARRLNRKQEEEDVVLGIRPKAIMTEMDLGFDPENTAALTVTMIEQLGDDLLVHGRIEGKEDELTLSTNPDGKFSVGQRIAISFDLSHICLFSKETQETILQPREN